MFVYARYACDSLFQMTMHMKDLYSFSNGFPRLWNSHARSKGYPPVLKKRKTNVSGFCQLKCKRYKPTRWLLTPSITHRTENLSDKPYPLRRSPHCHNSTRGTTVQLISQRLTIKRRTRVNADHQSIFATMFPHTNSSSNAMGGSRRALGVSFFQKRFTHQSYLKMASGPLMLSCPDQGRWRLRNAGPSLFACWLYKPCDPREMWLSFFSFRTNGIAFLFQIAAQSCSLSILNSTLLSSPLHSFSSITNRKSPTTRRALVTTMQKLGRSLLQSGRTSLRLSRLLGLQIIRLLRLVPGVSSFLVNTATCRWVEVSCSNVRLLL